MILRLFFVRVEELLVQLLDHNQELDVNPNWKALLEHFTSIVCAMRDASVEYTMTGTNESLEALVASEVEVDQYILLHLVPTINEANKKVGAK